MSLALNHRLILSVLGTIISLAQPLAAQHVLLAEDGGKMLLVRAAQGTRPCVEKNGIVAPIASLGFALKEVPEYLPVFISVRDEEAGSTYATVSGVGQVNNEFHFSATLETPYRLKDVFLALHLQPESAHETIFILEVGELAPNTPKPVVVRVPLNSPLGAMQYFIYIFSGGAEVLQSMIPFSAREAALDRMVASRIKDVQSAAPQFFCGPEPDYPAGLKKANLKGQAVIAIRIGSTGTVYDPVVKSSTDPAFGESALAAVRLWRFLPKVSDHHPVETKAEVPFFFSAPKPVATPR